jgi:hypothetical protein
MATELPLVSLKSSPGGGAMTSVFVLGYPTPFSRATSCTSALADSQPVAVREIRCHRGDVRWLELMYRFGKGRHMGARRSASTRFHQRFDEQLFDEQLRSLRKRTQTIARKPPLDFRYTVFVLRLLWVVVVVPFLTGAACAFFMGR